MRDSRGTKDLVRRELSTQPAVVPKLVVAAPARKPVILEFQTDAIELEEKAPPRLARITLYAVVLFLGCAVLWATISNIDETIVAPGKLITTRPLLVVQPLETSVIRSIAVKPGDVVRAGQTLARLDPTFSQSDAEQLRAKIVGFNAQIDRIDAELAGKSYLAPENAVAEQLLQARLSDQRKAYYDAKLRDFDTRIAYSDATLAASRDEEAVLTKRVDGLHEIDSMRQTLSKSGNGSRLSYLQGRDISLDIEASLGKVRGGQVETVQTLEQAKADRQAFIEDFRRTAMESLVELLNSRAAATEELKKAELRNTMAVLVAPADAAVLDIAQRSIGSVVREAEPLFTLVPLNVPLEAEVLVAAKDIGSLARQDPARIKFDAFPFQKHGTAKGTVHTISQDSFAPEAAAAEPGKAATPFYKVRIALDDVNLRSLPEGFRLLPGMTIQADIKASQRSVISYFLYPLLRGLDESFHEP